MPNGKFVMFYYLYMLHLWATDDVKMLQLNPCTVNWPDLSVHYDMVMNGPCFLDNLAM